MTWVIGGAAVLVVLTAGALVLQGKKKTPASAVDAEAEGAQTVSDADARPSPVDLAPKNPLNISDYQLDAMERARIWNSRAMLASIEVVAVDGIPQGPITFNFGVSLGQTTFDAPLDSALFAVEYVDSVGQAHEGHVEHARTALPEPNCPLEVAFRTVRDAGIVMEGTVGILLTHSPKHQRAVWMLTDTSGATHPVDADTCAMLRR